MCLFLQPCLVRIISLTLLYVTLMSSASAYETDQYSNRTLNVADSLPLLNARVNKAIADIAAGWKKPADDKSFARAIYYELGGWYWADKIERWAAASPEIEKYPQTRYHSIYRGMPVWATRVTYLFGVGRTFRVNGVMVGSDKFGHFFSQGFKYYKRGLKGWDQPRLLARGAFAERWIFGQWTTGNYANADLVANYEGMRFYMNLFADDEVTGKSSILKWRDGKPVQMRQFSWADHINDYWDEALNPSYLIDSLNEQLRPRISALCYLYDLHPARYVSDNDAILWRTYEHIGLKDMRANQFQHICSKGID